MSKSRHFLVAAAEKIKLEIFRRKFAGLIRLARYSRYIASSFIGHVEPDDLKGRRWGPIER